MIEVDKMNRPYIICHMVTSVDGKVTGDFLSHPSAEPAISTYYEINRKYKNQGSNGFICGRVTMEGSFTGGWYPDLTEYAAVTKDGDLKRDFIPEKLSGYYAIAFDTHGRLGWRSATVIDPDGDPGYDGAQIIEVLSEGIDERYLGYLEAMGIPYIFAGKDHIDVAIALSKLKDLFGCDTLLLEGGSIINGAFARAGAVDEISLVVAPVAADKEGKSLFMDSVILDLEMTNVENENGTLVLNYKKK